MKTSHITKKAIVKLPVIFGIIILLLAFIVLFLNFYSKRNFKGLKKMRINGRLIYYESADTREKRSKGLSGRDFLPKSTGMLFVFEKRDLYKFCMKDMNFPLDFFWLDNDVVVDTTKNIPPPEKNTPDNKLIRISPSRPCDKVLEINAGEVDKYNIKTGDRVEFLD